MGGRKKSAIAVKRVYEPASPRDGLRVLVDRLWPRGLSKKDAHVDVWLKDLAPSVELRKWFGHEEARWPEFKRRYFEELSGKREALDELAARTRGRRVTLLFAAKETRRNNAVALKEKLASYRRASG